MVRNQELVASAPGKAASARGKVTSARGKPARGRGKAASKAGVYVYGIVRADALEGRESLNSPAVGGRGDRVRAVRMRELAAFVSDSPEARYDVSRENLIAHQRVLEEILAFTEVIPAQFGLISASDARVSEQLLKTRHDELSAILAHIHGRVELGIKVLWKRDRIFTELATEIDEIRELRDEMASRPLGHNEQIRLGQLVEQAMAELRTRDAEQIVSELEELCAEMKTNHLLTDMMVLNAAFLVEKEHESRFDAAVDAIAERNAERLILKYVGPLPPFDFVNLNWEGGA
jgi:hypothetical protein